MAHQLSLIDLPVEVLRNILVFLDVHSLLQTSRTSHLLRAFSLDPLLQKARLEQARHDLNFLLLHRLPRSAISPPNAWIWLSKTTVLSRSISKSLIRIRLNHSLGRRPSVGDLVEKAILPECCSWMWTAIVNPVIIRQQEELRKSRLKDKLGQLLEHRPNIGRIVELNIIPAECTSGSAISPKIVETRRQVIKETLKDNLRAWLKKIAIEEQRRKAEEFQDGTDGISVKATVRRFTAWKAAAESEVGTNSALLEKRRTRSRWGRQVEVEKRKELRMTSVGACSQPTRAHVLGLRRFWEGMVNAAVR